VDLAAAGLAVVDLVAAGLAVVDLVAAIPATCQQVQIRWE
jgi:hypothetical protein